MQWCRLCPGEVWYRVWCLLRHVLPSRSGLEYVCEWIGNAGNATVGIAMRVVKGLNTPSAGYVILWGGNFNVSSVGQIPGSLYQSFSKRKITYNHSAIKILQAACHNFRCGSGSGVNKHDNGNDFVYWLILCVVCSVPLFYFSFGENNLLSLGTNRFTTSTASSSIPPPLPRRSIIRDVAPFCLSSDYPFLSPFGAFGGWSFR